MKKERKEEKKAWAAPHPLYPAAVSQARVGRDWVEAGDELCP